MVRSNIWLQAVALCFPLKEAQEVVRHTAFDQVILSDLDYPKGLRDERARAVTGRRNSHRWEEGRLFEPSAGFFYGNSCNFGTKSRKIVSKVGN